MSHGLTGNRASWWEWQLLDHNDSVVDSLSGMVEGSGSIELNVNAQTRLAGETTWVGLRSEVRDWVGYRLRPLHVEMVQGVEVAREPLGVFLPSTPSDQYGDTGNVKVPIGLYDKSLILREDQLPTDLGYPEGTNPVDAIKEQIILACGPAAEEQIAINDTAETLRTAMFWTIGTTRLRVINDLLKAMGYFAIWCDFNGVFRSSPYVRPADRGTEFHFHSGEECIYLPNYELQRDTFKVPNQLILITEGDGNVPGLRSVATNENPNHPFSYQRRKRWISQTISTEATSQAVLDAEAQRRLEEMSNIAASMSITHGPVLLHGHDKVHFSRAASAAGPEMELYGTVQAMTMAEGALWSTTLREVLPGLTEEVFEE